LEKSKVIEKLFEHIVVYSYLILPLLFLIYRPKPKDGMALAAYGIVIFTLLFFYWDVPREHLKLYQSIFTFFEYSFFALIFFLNVKNPSFRRFIIITSLAFYAFQVTHYYLTSSDDRIDSIPIGIESILIFIYIFLFFLEHLNNSKQRYLYTHHGFWISVALLVYLGGTFFINILGNTLTREEFIKYWYLNYIADTIKTLLFGVSIIVLSKRKDISQKPPTVPYLDIL
jgi:hypothetical protein